MRSPASAVMRALLRLHRRRAAFRRQHPRPVVRRIWPVWLITVSLGYMIGNIICTRLSVRWYHSAWSLNLVGATLLGIVAIAGTATAALDHRNAVHCQCPDDNRQRHGAAKHRTGAVSIRPSAASAAAGINGFVQMTLGAGIAQVSSYLVVAIPNAECIALFSTATTILEARLLS